MHSRSIFVPFLLAGLLSCARTGEGGATAVPLPEGHGRVCVAGPISQLFVSAQTVDGVIQRAELTGELTCMPIAPGRTMVVVQAGAESKPELLETWVDVGETTTIELGSPLVITATSADTQALARVFQHGRCALPKSDCSAAQLTAAIAALERASASTSTRERQAARLLAWSLLDDDARERGDLADEVWADLAGAPWVAASFPSELAAIADVLGDDARRKLEAFASHARDIGDEWPAYVRHRVLLGLIATAGVGGEADALRARVREVTWTDPELRASPLFTTVVEQVGFDPQVIAYAEVAARELVIPFAGQSCESGSRWLLYMHSPACPACKPAVEQLRALLDQGDPQLRVVTVAVDGDTPPLSERAEVESVALSPSLAAWFDEARGGVVTPYFMGLTCGDQLRLVGFGSIADATVWDARAVTSE